MTPPVLIDTHFVLWLRFEPQRLTQGERRALDDAPARYISIVSLWELAILLAVRRVKGDDQLLQPPEGFALLSVRPEHCRALLDLPRHHRDPFDRMLVAQARSEKLSLLTRDQTIAAYHTHATILRGPAS